jgi:hypothetical protein
MVIFRLFDMALGMSKLFESIYCVTLIIRIRHLPSFMSLAYFLLSPGFGIFIPLGGSSGGTYEKSAIRFIFFSEWFLAYAN